MKAGKIRSIGLSNETPWGTMKFLHYAELNNQEKVVSVQNVYNLLSRVYETGGSEIYHREGVGLLAYSPLAQGFLSGKYLDGNIPAGSRKSIADRLERYETPGADDAIRAYLALAEKYGIEPTQMANKFVTSRPFVTSNIIGATTMEQLRLAVTSNEVVLSEELEEIEAVHLRAPNLCP